VQPHEILGAGFALRRVHLWLARCPSAAMHAGVWDVVCLAAISAMGAGARRLRLHGSALGAGRVAVHEFWAALDDFCVVGTVPEEWREAVHAAPLHPLEPREAAVVVNTPRRRHRRPLRRR
jgi:hypothetical protein